MLLVGDIIGEVEQVLGRCDQPYLFAILTRAVETLTRKACGAPGSVTWDPMMIYVDLPVQRDFYVYLPHQIEKPIRININGNPAFSHNNLYEFTMNGPGSNDLEAGWQWQDRLTSPIQRRFPRGSWTLTATSDSEADEELELNIKVRSRRQADYTIQLPIAPAGTPAALSDPVYGIVEVVKPETVGTVTLKAGPYILAYYYPTVTLPEYSVIKLSQKAVSVRVLARRKTMKITSLLDVIPANSAQAVIMQCQTIKYLDEVHFDLAQGSEQAALTYQTEEQAARNAYIAASINNEILSALNLTIGQRDVVIVADVYDDAARVFGAIGRHKIFDRITSTLEVLYNKCQYWDGLMGVVTLRADDDYYVSLPPYVDTILAMNVNRTIGAYHSPWFEFSYAGLGEFNDLQQDPTNWEPWPQLAETQGSTNCLVNPYTTANCSATRINGTGRLAKGWEEVGTTPLAFRLKGPAQILAVPELGQDNGATITVYGYLNDVPVVDANGNWGVDIPCYANRMTPSKQIFDRIERVTKDPTYGFINLFAVNPFAAQVSPPIVPPSGIWNGMNWLWDGGGNWNWQQPPYPQTNFIALYWPWQTEPQYRLVRIGTMCKRLRVRYKKNWLKISQLTDPIHVRSREAIIQALTGVAALRTAGGGSAMNTLQPTAPAQIAMDQINLAVDMLDDEWRARNPHATITLQWPRQVYGNSFPQIV